ncbi:N-acetyltransferase, partial [Pseudomonas sp. GW460-12]|uniref:GNAT family N-acetyltransferase n=1 Tax=Pseudomonas sp. GW460-12 TaxID=2070621 RepID=UPI000CB08BE6
GTGRALVEAILAAARTKGYAFICLDTLPHLHEAQALYRKLGFVEISRYNDNPLPGVLFFGKHL